MTVRRVWLRHAPTNRRVPVEVPTVFGRSDGYYEYTSRDIRPDRLRKDVAEGLSALNYVKLCNDDQASRTHGLLDPSEPALCDLNSTNGTFLNEQEIPSRAGEAGPLIKVNDGDRVTVGRQTFIVELRDMAEAQVVEEVNQARFAIVVSGPHTLDAADMAERFLKEQKHFNVRRALGLDALQAGMSRLQALAPEDGLLAVILICSLRGEEVEVGGTHRPFGDLLQLLSRAPGRKLLIMAVDGDPSACEAHFANQAFEDSILLTGPQAAMVGGSELITPTLQSRLLRERGLAAIENPLDGLDELVAAATNILQVSWLDRHKGPLKVTFGSRPRPEEDGLSHSLRLGSSTFRF